MTEKAQNADFRAQKIVDFRRFALLVETQAVGGRRKPQIFKENSTKPQIGLRHLRSVTFSLVLETLRFVCPKSTRASDGNAARNLCDAELLAKRYGETCL